MDSEYFPGSLDFDKFAIGDMAYYHEAGIPLRNAARLRELHLTAHYFAHNAGRPPLVLALPDYSSPGAKLYFTVDGQCYSGTCTRCQKSVGRGCACPGVWTVRGHYDAWTVSGAPPAITVAPSINYDVPAQDGYPAEHRYHGFVQNGIIGDG
jgi:hypothetical protein